MAVSREFEKGARIFVAGAAAGFAAGACVVALLVWQFGAVIPTRAVNRQAGTADRWDSRPVDSDSPVLDSAVPTSGEGGRDRDPAIGAPPEGELAGRRLTMPIDGVEPSQLVASFDDARGNARRHEAIDIAAPHGTPVRAVEDGQIARLFSSKAGGITIYQFDPSERFCYYYAHLDRYADGLREQDRVRKGQVIGYVGVTGNAPKDAPHLHFAIFRLTSEKRWWEGTAIDPYPWLGK